MPIVTGVPGTTDRGTTNRERERRFRFSFSTVRAISFPCSGPEHSFRERGTLHRSRSAVTKIVPRCYPASWVLPNEARSLQSSASATARLPADPSRCTTKSYSPADSKRDSSTTLNNSMIDVGKKFKRIIVGGCTAISMNKYRLLNMYLQGLFFPTGKDYFLIVLLYSVYFYNYVS